MFFKGKFKNKEKGFTLIELLVVIAIIGILSSVVLVSLGSARAKARDARRISDIKQLQTALELYFNSYGRYPTRTEMANGTDGVPATAAIYISPKFMPSIPKDPLTTNSYAYSGLQVTGSTNCLSYHLGTVLEDVTGGSSVINSDVDAGVGTACVFTGLDVGTPFDGNTIDCVTVGGTIDACYDVTP